MARLRRLSYGNFSEADIWSKLGWTRAWSASGVIQMRKKRPCGRETVSSVSISDPPKGESSFKFVSSAEALPALADCAAVTIASWGFSDLTLRIRSSVAARRSVRVFCGEKIPATAPKPIWLLPARVTTPSFGAKVTSAPLSPPKGCQPSG
uniref:Uncharacterized protein n=1 Tax=Solibacter usitatus (strain Ellin6076) TaxID=234267 RepID=Q01UZ1_SOLUE